MRGGLALSGALAAQRIGAFYRHRLRSEPLPTPPPRSANATPPPDRWLVSHRPQRGVVCRHAGVRRCCAIARSSAVIDSRGARASRRAFAKDANRRWAAARPRPPRRRARRPSYRPVSGGSPTTWYVRKTGNDNNGGTSATVRSTGTDGVTNGTNTLTSAGASWTAADIGHGIFIGGVNVWRLITAVGSATSLTFSGATIAAGSGRTWTIGGAFLTWGKLLGGTTTPFASGDTVYIGAGTYRETALLSSGITPTVETQVIGDVTGAITGDSGEVRLTNYTSNDTTAPANAAVLGSTPSFYSFSRLTFSTGTNFAASGGTGAHDVAFSECSFLQNSGALSFAGSADQAQALSIWRCRFLATGTVANITINAARSTTADYNLGSSVVSCLAIGRGNLLSVGSTGSATFFGGGIIVASCTCYGATLVALSASQVSIVYPIYCYNSIAVGTTAFSALVLGQVIEDYNLVLGNTAYSSVNLGAHTVRTTTAYAPLFSFGQEIANGQRPRSPLSPAAGAPWLAWAQGFVRAARGATYADDATVGTVAWSNPSNADYSNNSYATAALDTTLNPTSHYLKATNFGFAIPSDATIVGVLVEYERSRTAGTGTPAIADNSIRLVKGGTIQGNDKAAAGDWGTTDTLTSRGALNDLWGLTLAYSDINASNFGVVISATVSGAASTASAQIDFIRITVAYTSPSSVETFDLDGALRPAGTGSPNATLGPLERGNTATKETSTVRTGTTAMKLTGPGYQDLDVPVDARATTLSVYARYDSTYAGGSLPAMQVINGEEVGVAADSDVMTGAADTWEQLSLAFTPTAKGIVTIRLSSRDTNGAGGAFFDDFGIV